LHLEDAALCLCAARIVASRRFLLPYTALFRSMRAMSTTGWCGRPCRRRWNGCGGIIRSSAHAAGRGSPEMTGARWPDKPATAIRSEEHTSELQSPYDLVCRLLVEKKKPTTSRE